MTTEDSKQFSSDIQQKAFENLMNEANILRKGSILTDFVLECENNIFPVHKMVLAASSPYFKHKFTQQENFHQTAMTIDFMRSEVLQIILDFVYTGTIILKEEQSVEQLKNLLKISCKLQIKVLSNYFLDLLLKKVPKIYLADWKEIEELNSELLNQIDVTNILDKLPETEPDFFAHCTHNQITRLLFCPSAVKYNQSVILKYILNWVKYDSNERKKHLNEFLEKLDFDRISPTVLSMFKHEELLLGNTLFLAACSRWMFRQLDGDTKASRKEPHITESQELPSQLQEMHIGSSSEIAMNINSRSNGYKLKFLICGKIKSYPRTQVFIYDYSTDELQRMLAHPLYSVPNSAKLNCKDFIYVIAECNEYRFIYAYDTVKNSWIELNYKPCKFTGSSAVEWNGYIYVAAGSDFMESFRSLERYDLEADEWEVVGKISNRVCAYCGYDNALYNRTSCAKCKWALFSAEITQIVAGDDCLYAWFCNKLYKYTPQEDEWDPVESDLSNQLQSEDVHLAFGNEKLFLIEKLKPSNVWIYDTENCGLKEDVIPGFKECDGIMNLNNPQYLEFLVSEMENGLFTDLCIHGPLSNQRNLQISNFQC